MLNLILSSSSEHAEISLYDVISLIIAGLSLILSTILTIRELINASKKIKATAIILKKDTYEKGYTEVRVNLVNISQNPLSILKFSIENNSAFIPNKGLEEFCPIYLEVSETKKIILFFNNDCFKKKTKIKISTSNGNLSIKATFFFPKTKQED